ncbi:hypothetical protein SUGI_0384600 [Cryptomeria japonica]|nr:hypothetical protein SUGI_0384600 [Cryptomeria japonica]
MIHLAFKRAKIPLIYSSNPQKAQEVAATVNSSVPITTTIASRVDISNLARVIDLLNKAEEAFGLVHIIVNNARVMDTKYSSLAEISEQDWDKTFNINCKGAFICSKEVAKRLVHDGGQIINEFCVRDLAFTLHSLGSIKGQ